MAIPPEPTLPTAPDTLPQRELGAPPEPTFFDEIVAYIGFTELDSHLLAEFLIIAEPHFTSISEHFYERILAHPQAHAAMTGGQEQIDRLKRTLVDWMRSGLAGPHDHAFLVRRARIGHIHVRIGLPQRYMITAMNVMRLDFLNVLREELPQIGLDRLDVLGAALNRLFDLELAIMLETYKLDADEKLRRRERLATIGQLAASIGHDLRNPLSVMESSLYLLRRRARDDERILKHVDRIGRQIDECETIISHLLELARNQEPRRERIELAELLDAAIDAALVPERVAVERSGLADTLVWLDGPLIKQALVNLLVNAVQAQRDRPRPWIGIHVERVGAHVVISLEDAGPGFDAMALPLAFEPLITTKSTGTGLGLALVRSIVERHGGKVSARNRAQGGAVVEMRLPDSGPESP